MKGRLVTLEGIDGVGKTTHVNLLVGHLKKRGLRVTTYREPGATKLGEELRRILKSGLVQSAVGELMLFAAARAELIESMIKPDLDAGGFVVLDRFTDSTKAYQGALEAVDEGSMDAICRVAAGGMVPDLTLWLDLPPGRAFRRRYPLVQAMSDSDPATGEPPEELDAIERRDMGYFTRVSERYAAIHRDNPGRVVRIDAEGSVEETSALIREAIDNKLAEWGHV